MIDFRYHLVSLVSVFLALAVGIVLGAGPLQGVDRRHPDQPGAGAAPGQGRAAQRSSTPASAGIDAPRRVHRRGRHPSCSAGSSRTAPSSLVRLPGVDDAAVEPLADALGDGRRHRHRPDRAQRRLDRPGPGRRLRDAAGRRARASGVAGPARRQSTEARIAAPAGPGRGRPRTGGAAPVDRDRYRGAGRADRRPAGQRRRASCPPAPDLAVLLAPAVPEPPRASRQPTPPPDDTVELRSAWRTRWTASRRRGRDRPGVLGDRAAA